MYLIEILSIREFREYGVITKITGGNAASNTALLDEMFRSRKRLFGDRLGWTVSNDAEGREIDRYDALEPLYLIATDDPGHHIGSLRLLPTTGDTMLHHHFSTVLDDVAFESPKIWECTRFCVDGDHVGQGANGMTALHVEHVTNCLLLGLCETAMSEGLAKVVGAFDRQTLRTFHNSGWSPAVIGHSGEGEDAVFLGVWDVSADSVAAIREASGVTGTVL